MFDGDNTDLKEREAAASYARDVAKTLPPGYAVVPTEPTEAMWGGLARDIVMWDRFQRRSGADLHKHLRSIGRAIPDWLALEIHDTDQTPPKGTVAACIYKAMIEAFTSTSN